MIISHYKDGTLLEIETVHGYNAKRLIDHDHYSRIDDVDPFW